jgi:hypothetical protein
MLKNTETLLPRAYDMLYHKCVSRAVRLGD